MRVPLLKGGCSAPKVDGSLTGSSPFLSPTPDTREAPLAQPLIFPTRTDHQLLPPAAGLTSLICITRSMISALHPHACCSALGPQLRPGPMQHPPPCHPFPCILPPVLHAAAEDCPVQNFHDIQQLGVAFEGIKVRGACLLCSGTQFLEQQPAHVSCIPWATFCPKASA